MPQRIIRFCVARKPDGIYDRDRRLIKRRQQRAVNLMPLDNEKLMIEKNGAQRFAA